MSGPTSFDQKVYDALKRPEFLPDEYKSWLPKYLRFISSLQVSKQQIPGIMGEPWRNVDAPNQPVFQNSFVNYGAPWVPARFYKDYVGLIYVRGLVKNATSQSPGTKTIFTLPVGYRPDQQLIFAADGSSGSAGHHRIDVMTNGDVVANFSATGAVVYLSLSNISFRAI